MSYEIYMSPFCELYHHGIRGQKWGVRRYQNSDGTYTEEGQRRRSISQVIVESKAKRSARKDAKEFARSKMYYGEGAGNRRKLIKAAVEERSKDPVYKAEYDKALAKQDMANHAAKARIERNTRDATHTFVKKVPKVLGSVAAAGAFYIANKQTIDSFIDKAMRR